MGHCVSKDEKDKKKLNRQIEDQIKKDQSILLRIVKLLLLGKFYIYLCLNLFFLGAGESGKSTILKQMR